MGLVKDSVCPDDRARLRNSPLPSSSSHLFPSRVVQEAVDSLRSKEQADLVHRAVTSTGKAARFPGGGKGQTSSAVPAAVAGPSGTGSALVPKATQQQGSSYSAGASGNRQKGKPAAASFPKASQNQGAPKKKAKGKRKK